MAKLTTQTLLAAILAVAGMLAIEAASPPPALAQECYTPHNCGPLYYTIFEHEQSGGNDRYKPPGWDGCDVCELYTGSGWEVFPYFYCAAPCFEDGLDTPEQAAAYQSMLDAIEKNDLAAVLAVAPSFPSSVAYNAERQAIQVKSCSGSIVAHLPVTDDPAVLVAVRELVKRGSLSVVALRE